MVSINELRTKLRKIRKQLAEGVGYGDFKYLHRKTKPELEALLKKYEKFDNSNANAANVIQRAVKNKKARNQAQRLLNIRDERQIVRDLENRLSAVSRPQSAPTILSANIGTSISKRRANIRNIYDEPLTPFSTFNLFNAPPFVVSQDVPEQMFQRRSVAEGRVVPLPRVPKTQRPQTTSLRALQLRERFNLSQRAATASPWPLPPVQYRERLQNNERPFSASSGRKSGLGRVQNKPRPSSADRTFNKFSPL
jgi:hypothetical protein